MSQRVISKTQVETIPTTNGDTPTYSMKKISERKTDRSSPLESTSSNVSTVDGLYFKSDNELDRQIEDRLALLYKTGIDRQVKEVEDKAEKRQIGEIFAFDESISLNENIPGVNMTFLDRLFHQLTRAPPSDTEEDLNDDVFVDVNQREITPTNKINTEESDQTSPKTKRSFMENLRLFFDDLTAETDVVRGVVDEETLINRRCHQAKSSHLSNNNSEFTMF